MCRWICVTLCLKQEGGKGFLCILLAVTNICTWTEMMRLIVLSNKCSKEQKTSLSKKSFFGKLRNRLWRRKDKFKKDTVWKKYSMGFYSLLDKPKPSFNPRLLSALSVLLKWLHLLVIFLVWVAMSGFTTARGLISTERDLISDEVS